MNDFKILVCEDLIKDIRDIKLYLNSLKSEITDVNIDYKIVDFDNIYEEMKEKYNLLILDLYDEKTGYQGDSVLKHNIKQIPTLIYTNRGDELKFDLKVKQGEYHFLLEKLTKLQDGNNLKSFIKSYISEKNINGPLYSLYNENDEILINSLITIGENNFNEIICEIMKKLNKNKILVHATISGLSGAILFKIEIDGKYSFLKLSKDIDKLKEEHRNAIELYHKFPNRLINHIDYDEFYSYNKSVLGILSKEVDHSQSLFDFIRDELTTQNKIEDFLNNLFIDEQGLQNHYHNNQQGITDWTSIFNKITEQKIYLIITSFKELNPIIKKYYNNFDVEDFRRISILHNYNNLNNNILLNAKYKKKNVLSHGDFHSKNILIQSGHHPVLIDTGAISYQYWCLDICRLIVNLFINGTDFGTVNFFEINSIPQYINIVDKLLIQENIEMDNANNNVFHAINWLIKNVSIIFEPEFELFEYQLGLMKEFLQISYRFDTVPPNKRALALIAAHKSMIAANENCRNSIQHFV